MQALKAVAYESVKEKNPKNEGVPPPDPPSRDCPHPVASELVSDVDRAHSSSEMRYASPDSRQIDVLDSSAGLQDPTLFSPVLLREGNSQVLADLPRQLISDLGMARN